jgi:hypothetical protein
MSLSEEVKAKLTPEQLIIAEKWEVERFQRQAIMSQIELGVISFSEALDNIREITPDFCEHGRSVMGTCWSCEEIERIIRPEAFDIEEED